MKWVILLVLLAAFLYFTMRMMRPHGRALGRRTAPSTIAGRPVDSEVLAHVVALGRSGSKLQAVRVLREATGLEPEEARQVVDRLVTEHPPGTPLPASVNLTLNGRSYSFSTRRVPAEQAPAPEPRVPLADRVRALARQGREVDAVRMLQGEAGMSTEEARAFLRSVADSRSTS